MDNPIKYSEFFSPDGSLDELVKKLENIDKTFEGMKNSVVAAAKELEAALKKVNTTTDEGREQTKKGASDADKLKKAYDDLTKSQSENATELIRLKRELAEQNKLNKLTEKLNNATEDSFDALSAQYALNTLQLNKMSKAQREATKEGKDLEAQTKAIYEEMKRLQSNTGAKQLNVGNYPDIESIKAQMAGYAESLKDITGLNTQFGSSLLNLSQSGAGTNTLFTTLSSGVKAFGQTLLGLLTNPVFLTIAGIASVGAAFKFWFDYNQGLAEATKLTQQFTGKSGDDLKAYRNDVQAVADMYGKDFKDVLQSTNAVSKQFGISQEEALKNVKDGFIAGADANGEFLENLKEYPAYFKEAGISASQFVAITTQANKAGIYSDKGIDAIKEGNLRIREMTTATAAALDGIGINSKKVQKDLQSGSKTTFQVMQEVSKKLNELPESSAAVGTAIADVFGGPGEDAGLQYLKTLKDIDTNLDNVKKSTGELGQLQERQLESQKELNNVTAGFFDATGGTFESLIANSKIFINEMLVGMIKGVVSLANYFIDLYNESTVFRAGVQAVTTAFNVLWNTTKSFFTYMFDNLKALGSILKGVFTLNFDEIKGAFDQLGKDTIKLTKNIVAGTVKEVENGFGRMRKKIKPITIGLQVGTPENPNPTPTGNGKPKPPPAKPKSDKDLEAIRKLNLDAVRKYEDSITNLENDELKKRRDQTQLNYDRQIEDLKHQLKTEKNLTATGKEAITKTLKNLESERDNELEKIYKDIKKRDDDKRLLALNTEKQAIQLRLDAVKKGSSDELALRAELIEQERKIALQENSVKPRDQQQTAEAINATFNFRRDLLKDEYGQLKLLQFDQQQDLQQSEFDLLRKTEAEKTRFRLTQEKTRLQKILELNMTAFTKLSAAEVASIQNTIAKIDKELGKVRDTDVDLYSLLGINLDDAEKEAIATSTQFAIGQVQNFLQAKIDAANKGVETAKTEVDAAKNALNTELQARANGYASNVAQAQKDLDLAKKTQDKALKQQEQARKQQAAIDTLTQVSSLVTAVAKIWGTVGNPFIAIPAIALMFGSFALAKIKAGQAAKQKTYGDGGFEFMDYGGSHASGNDIGIGTTAKGEDRRMERGETLAVFNKRNTRKYRRHIPGIVNAINRGTFEKTYMQAYSGLGNISVQNSSDVDMRKTEGYLKDIRNQGERRILTDGKGRTIEKYKNLTRIYT